MSVGKDKEKKVEYKKPPLTFNEQLDLLINRGLQVKDKKAAVGYLNKISYYRLSAYFLPFKQSEKFCPEANFEKIINLYDFDRKLRLLVLEAIETIEVALRTRLIYHLSHKYGAFGYLKPENFSPRFNHEKWLKYLKISISDSTETFIEHYKRKYTLSAELPLWMSLEVMSFGGLSHLLKGLKGEDQQVIAKLYDLQSPVLVSWLHSLVYLRNICAHHARLWNRVLTFKPKLPIKSKIWKDIKNDRIYVLLKILEYFLDKINSDSAWGYKIRDLLKDYPDVLLFPMGFPKERNVQAEEFLA